MGSYYVIFIKALNQTLQKSMQAVLQAK